MPDYLSASGDDRRARNSYLLLMGRMGAHLDHFGDNDQRIEEG